MNEILVIFFYSLFSARNPQTWVKPYAAEVVYNYKSTSPHELNVYPGQLIQLAPREVQQTHKLLNTGWALATIDNTTSGLVPINYVRRVEAKTFANNGNEPVIESDIPITESDIKKNMESHFNDENSQIIMNDIPPNLNDEINEINPDDIKDL